MEPTPQVDYSNYDFSNLDIPQWGGAYTAPLTTQQLDAMRGFDVMSRNNPVAQTLNYMQQQGGNIQDLGNAFRPYGAGYGGLESMASGGSQWGMPNYSDFSGINHQAQGIASGRNNPVSDYSSPANWLGWGGNQLIDQAVGNAGAQADVSGVTGFINNLLGGGGAGQTDGLINTVMNQFGSGFNQSFDTAPYMQNAQALFSDQLGQQLGKIREEGSALGLNPGASDRADLLGRAAGAATSQFNLGMTDLARQNFENTQNRNMGLLGMSPQLGGLTQMPTNQQLSALPTMLQAMGMNPQLQQRNAELLLGASGQRGNIASTYADLIGRNTQEQQQGIQNSMQMLPFMAQLQQLPFEQQMEAYNTIYNPGYNRQLQASQGLAGLDADAIKQGMAGLTQQGTMYGQSFGLGEAARGIADQDLARAIAEFQRTQGGGLQQALALMGQVPGLNTGFGPSSASQWGQTLAGLAGLGTGIADIYKTFR